MPDNRPVLRLGHSPDPDDAFMWWPLTRPAGGPAPLDSGRFLFEPVLQDIETLNRRAERGELEITALSCAQYPHVRRLYALTACGASMGDGFGPKLVARRPMTVDDLIAGGHVVAIPGERTSAFAAMRLMMSMRPCRWVAVPFDQIIERVAAGEFEAGLVIHEGQLSFSSAGLHLVADLGAWWSQRWHCPLPLGVNAIRRDLDDRFGLGTLRAVTATLGRSVRYALANRQAALRHAMRFARSATAEEADRFVDLYVNQWTLDFGPMGRKAVELFLGESAKAGLVPDPGPIDFIEAAGD